MKTEQEIAKFQYWDSLEAVLDHVQEGIYITDSEANTVYMNHAYELISGLPNTEVLGKNMADLVKNGVISRSGTLMVLESGEPVTIEQSFRTGKRALITSTPVYGDPAGKKNILMIVTSVREVTELYSIRKELEKYKMQNMQYVNDLKYLRDKYQEDAEFVAVADETVKTLRYAQRMAISDTPILLSGETATGKEKLARFIHEHSRRAQFPFMNINFNVIPQNEAVEYLFGWEDTARGEYRVGIIECADGGTIYLDEITEMPPQIRGRLLALLTTGSCVLGDGMLHRLNIRFIAGSCYSLEQLQAQQRMEEEILDCFSLFHLQLAPVRERREDIIPLLEYFLRQYEQKTGEKKHFSREAFAQLVGYDWPGNVGEIYSLVQRAAIMSDGEEISPDHILLDLQNKAQEAKPAEDKAALQSADPVLADENINLKTEVAKFEASYMTLAFAKYKNIRNAAEALGMDSSTFVRKRQRYEKLGLMDKERKKD